MREFAHIRATSRQAPAALWERIPLDLWGAMLAVIAAGALSAAGLMP